MSTPSLSRIARSSEAGVGNGVDISWSDGLETFLSAETLRRSCPCAVCMQKRGDNSHEKPLTGGRAMLQVLTATRDEELQLDRIWAVGNYAIGMRWQDGHDSGIYTYRFLRELSEKAAERTGAV